MSTFQFNGVSSSAYSSLVVSDIGRRQRAKEQIDTYVIPYRDGSLHVHSGKYYSYQRQMLLGVKNKTQRAAIAAWLTGSGRLITSDDADGYFNASVVSALDVTGLSRKFDSFKVTFECEPFFYLDSGDTLVEYTTSPVTLVNLGTVAAKPYIKITGSGTVVLTIGSVSTTFVIDGYMECDSLLDLCYKGAENEGDNMTGEFPSIPVGSTAMSWTGTVSKIEIIPRWREL